MEALLHFQRGGVEVGLVRYVYDRDAYTGSITTTGIDKALLDLIFSQALSVYIPELGGPTGSDKPRPELWGWVVGVARRVSGSANTFFEAVEVENAPSQSFFRPLPPMPEGTIA